MTAHKGNITKLTIDDVDCTNTLSNINTIISPFQKELRELIAKHWEIAGVSVSPDEIDLNILPARNGEMKIIIGVPKS